MKFNKCVGRAAHRAGIVERAQHRAHQRGLARAQRAAQIHHQPFLSRQRARQGRAQRRRRRLIGQRQRARGLGIIVVMQTGHGNSPPENAAALLALRGQINAWARELGLECAGVTGIDLADAEPGLLAWLDAGFHGGMDYMARHGLMRARPAELLPGTLRAICVCLPYWPRAQDARTTLADPLAAYIARYALGRDYHKTLRRRLQKLAERIHAAAPHGFRVFVDSAPVLEVELARRAQLGWRGKHTLLVGRKLGSFFFLGEIFTDLPLPIDAPQPAANHCGRCTACLRACPTGAILAPYRLDARRCISYLTIEHAGEIPAELRPAIGNRIYGCDDCQLACPWNRFAQRTREADFAPRHGLDAASLCQLAAWSEDDFRQRMAGSAIARIGFERWQRNLAVALANAPATPDVLRARAHLAATGSALVRAHLPAADGSPALL